MKEAANDDIASAVRLAVSKRKRELPQAALEPVTGSDAIGFYTWGTKIRFGFGGQAREFLRAGWNYDEPGFVWTEGVRASIGMRIKPPSGDIRLSLCAKAMTTHQKPRQTLRLRSNANVDLNWVVSGEFSWVRGRLFYQQICGLKELLIDLVSEAPVSPASLGLGDDTRVLGVAVAELIMEMDQ